MPTTAADVGLLEADRAQPMTLRMHADMETGKDEPEPHQVAALVNCATLSMGELRELLIYCDSSSIRAKAAFEFEARCYAKAFETLAKELRPRPTLSVVPR